MIESMTGFGSVQLLLNHSIYTITIKSLNSKNIDVSLRLPNVFNSKEIGIRQTIVGMLKRGKVDLFVKKEKHVDSNNYLIDKSIFKEFYNQIISIEKELNITSENKTQAILKMPEVYRKSDDEGNLKDWPQIEKGILDAIKELILFRQTEGKKLKDDIKLKMDSIKILLLKLSSLEKERIKRKREILSAKIKEIQKDLIDKNRLEQELLYYLEKMDINEEIVRLEAHLTYFLETLTTKHQSGKKLIFISQEIVREVNTLGAKAADSTIQKIVVEMKYELEKVREQLLNIL